MATNDEMCRGCSSFGTNTSGLECHLKPIYNGKECPCLTCLVKGICMADDIDCDMYHVS